MQILDDLVLQMVKLLDNVVPEQVIDVPKISPSSFPQRSVDRDPQRVEQLVEVATVVSSSFLQLHSLEQTVDIPVLGGVKRARGGLTGSVPGQSSTAFSGAAAASQKTVAEESVARFVEHSEAVFVAVKTGKFMVASQKTVAEKSVAKVAGNSEAVSVAAKTGKFMVASQMTVAEKSVAKVVEHSEPVSVAAKAGQVITASQKTGEFP